MKCILIIVFSSLIVVNCDPVPSFLDKIGDIFRDDAIVPAISNLTHIDDIAVANGPTLPTTTVIASELPISSSDASKKETDMSAIGSNDLMDKSSSTTGLKQEDNETTPTTTIQPMQSDHHEAGEESTTPVPTTTTLATTSQDTVTKDSSATSEGPVSSSSDSSLPNFIPDEPAVDINDKKFTDIVWPDVFSGDEPTNQQREFNNELNNLLPVTTTEGTTSTKSVEQVVKDEPSKPSEPRITVAGGGSNSAVSSGFSLIVLLFSTLVLLS